MNVLGVLLKIAAELLATQVTNKLFIRTSPIEPNGYLFLFVGCVLFHIKNIIKDILASITIPVKVLIIIVLPPHQRAKAARPNANANWTKKQAMP